MTGPFSSFSPGSSNNSSGDSTNCGMAGPFFSFVPGQLRNGRPLLQLQSRSINQLKCRSLHWQRSSFIQWQRSRSLLLLMFKPIH
ncbi:hypothetical protein DPMN_069178 [Dreissena polymorpha]|uniref:Uncharacterized protein n=1 Tax=Dreissena polymorpha TaxID=45954 RepID=A0A9D4BU50_DREPO|nr:hypothetical protein DPMN_069178 [Dreissena polymorpha]